MAQLLVTHEPSERSLRALNYSGAVERVRRAHGSKEATQLGRLVASAGSAYGSVFRRVDCAPDVGIELLSQADMFASEPCGRVIRRDSMSHPERHEVQRWQLLIAGAGTLGETELYGRPMIADSRLMAKYVGPDAMVLSFPEPGGVENLFTYAYLATKTGIETVRATSYGTKLLRFRSDLLSGVPVPVPPRDLANRVAALVREAVQYRDVYAAEIAAARSRILALPAIAEVASCCVERTRRVAVWDGPLKTLGAWNYAATGSAMRILGKRWSGRLGDVIQPNGLFNGPRFARVNCARGLGVDFMSQRDVFLIRPIPRHIARPRVPDPLLFVSRDALLVGSHGQVTEGSIFGKTELAECTVGSSALTQDILRVLPRSGYRDILYAFLSTHVGAALLRQAAVGTSIPTLRVDLVPDIPFPDLAEKERAVVSAHVQAAVNARTDSLKAEQAAIRIVEEEVLPEWLA